MKRFIVRVPLRADLAGGTLDLWPLYLFHPGSRTVNVAISFHAECEILTTGRTTVEIDLTDHNYQREYASTADLLEDPKASLIARTVQHFQLSGLRIITRTDAPRGSGLGGSSALAIALVRGLSEIAGDPVEGEQLIALVRDLETRLLGVPAGVQDYYPPVYGGLASLRLNPGTLKRQPISLPVSELAQHFVLHYSEVQHFSGTNNWEMYKRQIDGDGKVQAGLARISSAAMAMEEALDRHDVAGAGKALGDEWEARKQLIEGISTPEIDQAIEAARKAGAYGGKVCGAGGGGCIVFLMPKEKRERVVRALGKVPGRVIDAVPVAYGLSIEQLDEKQTAFSFDSRRTRASQGENPEQLFLVSSRRGNYRPFILAEGAVTYDQPGGGGIHRTSVHLLMAPIDRKSERIDWQRASHPRQEDLELTAVPDAKRKFEINPDEDFVRSATSTGEESLRLFLAETERSSIYFNKRFGIYSEPDENREMFVHRCIQAAQRELDAEGERLESTFRRRIDQMRERSEREQREIEASGEADNDTKTNDVNIAWGQTLYNITSGKPAGTDSPTSVHEADYMEKIAQLQKIWERELNDKKEELFSQARSVEELTLTPSTRKIEIRKFVLVWSPSRGAVSTDPGTTRRPRASSGFRRQM